MDMAAHGMVEVALVGDPASAEFRALAEEVNRRYGQYLKQPANARLVSAVCRRRLANGELRLVKEGTPHREALYAKV